MNNLKYILESIQKGVKLALDDFDFNDENISSYKDEVVKQDDARDHIFKKHVLPKIKKLSNIQSLYYIIISARYDNKPSEYIKYWLQSSNFNFDDSDIGFIIEHLEKNNIVLREYVDLNLPSGTLWCQENLGISDGVFYSKLGKGSTTEKEYKLSNGSFYVWGDIKPNPSTSGGDILKNVGKYYVDLLMKNMSRYPLQLKDDPAYNVNNHYRTPSLDHFIELFNNTNMIELEGHGIIFVSKKNIFDFTYFNRDLGNTQYMYLTSELAPRNDKFVRDIANGGNKELKFVKLYKDDKPNPRITGYPVW